jgi:hypothetical protein
LPGGTGLRPLADIEPNPCGNYAPRLPLAALPAGMGASAVPRCAVRSRAASPVTLRRLAPRKDCHEAWSHVSALCRPHP